MTRPTEADEVSPKLDLRALSAADFEAVVEMDLRIIGRSRRGYMEKRLKAAVRHPDAHIQLAAVEGGRLIGLVLARIVEGEFGRNEAAVILEAIGIEPARQHRGTGRKLLDGLEQVMRRKGIHDLTTQAEWTNQSLLGFLGATGFTLAPRQILECPTTLAARL